MRVACIALYNCMLRCMAFLLYGTKYSTHHKHHTHVADLPDIHSQTHTQLLACKWKLVWASLKPRPPGA